MNFLIRILILMSKTHVSIAIYVDNIIPVFRFQLRIFKLYLRWAAAHVLNTYLSPNLKVSI